MSVYLDLEHDDAELLDRILFDIRHGFPVDQWNKDLIYTGRLDTIAGDLEDAIRAAKEQESEGE